MEVRIKDYYGNPSYYSVMPVEIFDALEQAFLKDEEYATVDKALFDKMIVDYKQKMSSHELSTQKGNPQ